jgi:hypothetical protein
MLVRLEGSNRIQHLARVRNMALAPLYQVRSGVPVCRVKGGQD